MVTVTLLREAREQLIELPRAIVHRMYKLLTRLREWPSVSGVKHLRGDVAGKCRLRTGDYRLQFHVEETNRKVRQTRKVKGKEINEETEVTDYTVVVEKIGLRDGFYEDT